MKTLYDLLGALPNDDAEGLRSAFRNAVKGSHPDIHPGDPDAGLKFRQIVRANEILRDPEQRAAYDHLMDLARVEQESASKYVIAGRIYKLAFGLIGLAGGSVATVGMYLLLMHVSSAMTDRIDTAQGEPVEMAALARATPQDVGEAAMQPAKDEAGVPTDIIAPHVVTSQTITETGVTVTAALPDADASEALRARGIAAYRSGDLDGAMADLDQAIQLNPKFAAAYIDRGIVLYRMQKFDRALADVARAKQIESRHAPGRARPEAVTTGKSEPATAGKPDSVVRKPQRSAQAATPMVLTPATQRRAGGQDASRLESTAFLRVR